MAIPLTEPLWEQLDFPVSLQPVETQNPQGEKILIPRARSVFREDSETILDIVSAGYKLVPHMEVFRPLHDLMGDLPFSLETVETSIGQGGGYARVEWFFDERVEVRPGDDVQLTLLVHNSLDRSATLRAELAANRLICSNGLRSPGPSFLRAWKHRKALDIRDVFGWIKRVFKMAPLMVGHWQNWSDRQIFLQRLKEFLEVDPQASGLIGKASREGIIGRLERDVGGRKKVSIWQAYNAITEYASHRIRTRRGDLLATRQEQVHRMALRFADWAEER